MLSPDMPVEVYRNIRTNVWSIRHATAKLVVGHASRLVLTHCEFRVSQPGRLRVLATKRKNVHASVRGRLVSWEPVGAPPSPLERPPEAVQVTYNPYKNTQFVTVEGDVPVVLASKVWLDDDMRVYAIPKDPPKVFRYRTTFADGSLYGTLLLDAAVEVGTHLWLDTGFVHAFRARLPLRSTRSGKVFEVVVTRIEANQVVVGRV